MGETVWRRLVGCYCLTHVRSFCSYRGLVDLGAGPVLADVRYYATPDEWPDVPPSKLPHMFANPWWDKVQGDPSRWTPGTPPVWQDGTAPTPIDPCPCWDTPGSPPCSANCGQLPPVLVADGIAYSGSGFTSLPLTGATWSAGPGWYDFEGTAFGEVVTAHLVYVPSTDHWTITWWIDGDPQGTHGLGHFGPCDSSRDLISTGSHAIVQWTVRILGPWY